MAEVEGAAAAADEAETAGAAAQPQTAMAEKHQGGAFGPASPWDRSAASAAGPGTRGSLRHRDVFPL
eukprot:5945699-Pyramimonas_sp.AAC.1